MDLVNPFFPTVVDQVQARRGRPHRGPVLRHSSTSLITAYADEDPVVDAEDWAVDGMVYVLYGQHTVGRSDIGLMLGEVCNDAVVGLTIASSIGPVAVHADATYTQPDLPEEDPFVQGVVGALWAATGDLTLSGGSTTSRSVLRTPMATSRAANRALRTRRAVAGGADVRVGVGELPSDAANPRDRGRHRRRRWKRAPGTECGRQCQR